MGWFNEFAGVMYWVKIGEVERTSQIVNSLIGNAKIGGTGKDRQVRTGDSYPRYLGYSIDSYCDIFQQVTT